MGGEWTLAGYLAQMGFLSRQSEVLCTHGLTYLLEDFASSAAFARYLSSQTGVEVPTDLVWRAEVGHPNGGRVDVEGQTDLGIPIVEIEAKLGAALDPRQLRSYANHVVAHGANDPVLLVLVPYRLKEATSVIREAFGVDGAGPSWRAAEPPVSITITGWDEALDVIQGALTGQRADDATQLRGMYLTFTGDFHVPRGGLAWRDHEADFVALVDQATRQLFDPGELYPMGFEPEARDEHAYGYRRRYTPSLVSPDTALSIGVRDPFEGHSTPIWLRYHCKTPSFSVALKHLHESTYASTLVPGTTHAWLPLEPLTGDSAGTAVADLVGQARAIDRAAAGLPP